MSEAADRWHECAGAFALRLGAVGDDQWEGATPCDAWTVRQLVDHAVGTQVRFGGLLGLRSESVDWPAVCESMTELLSGEGVLDGTVNVGPLGEMSKIQALMFARMICSFTRGILLGRLAIAKRFRSMPSPRAISGCRTCRLNLSGRRADTWTQWVSMRTPTCRRRCLLSRVVNPDEFESVGVRFYFVLRSVKGGPLSLMWWRSRR